MKNQRILASLYGLLAFSLTATAGSMHHLRGTRYCEILLSKSAFTFSVYNTIGLNDCPAKQWDKLSVDELKKSTQARQVHLNGPRYWVIDSLTHSKTVNATPRVLGGIPMREAGILHLSLFDVIAGHKAYHPITVDRETTWVFNAHKPVYELINPKGEVFVMQSFSTQKQVQTESSLATLGSRLHLPQGWQFHTGLIANDQFVTAIDHKAVVVQDDYQNTYQKATHDLLK